MHLIKEFQLYLLQNLGITIVFKKWHGEKGLPILFRDLYDCYETVILNTTFLVVAAKNDDVQTLAAIKKHLTILQEKSGLEPVFLCASIASFNRKRLIEHKISFVIPGNQMYLPIMGIDLREHIAKIRSPEIKTLSPAAQCVILFSLYRNEDSGLTTSLLAKVSGYSIMTLKRAFDEIQLVALGEIYFEGRERLLRLIINRKDLWKKALNYLRSPVTKRFFTPHSIPDDVRLPYAGLSALSYYSMLAEPRNRVLAISSTEWKELKNKVEFFETDIFGDDTLELEVWSYSPYLFADKGNVDRISLYLSLKDTTDERIVSALEEMMEFFEWSRD
jgi:hypothetical protein